MGLISGFLTAFTKASNNGKIDESEFVFYKIVNFNERDKKYWLQCINTKATFLAALNDIVLDRTILYGLHPIQACFIGIEYAADAKNNQNPVSFPDCSMNTYTFCRYGSFLLRYQDRKQNLCFINIDTKKEFIMDPRDIALSEHLIREFDAIQAFYIGFMAGLKMNTFAKLHSKPRLTLIKK